MIRDNEITLIGSFGKPHGVKGEINLLTSCEIENLSCVVVDIEGINVPFFFDSVRKRGREAYLVTIDGINSDVEVSLLVNKDVFALKTEVDNDCECEDGFYAEDLIGYKVVSHEPMLVGEIVDVDDLTENVLFVVRTDDGRQVLVPVADEFIDSIDADRHVITLNLPMGLIEL